MHVVIAGSSGFLGSHLGAELRGRGHTVTSLVRRPAQGPAEASWDPYAERYDPALIETADVVVNLAGSPLLGNPHSRRWAERMLESRVTTTRVLAGAVARSQRRPALLAGNGTSWYGDHGPADLTEASDSRGHALLTRVTREWEAATTPARETGARVCVLRTAPVMDRRSGPLRLATPVFRAGLGGRLGAGTQYLPMVSLRDWVGAAAHLAEHDSASGAFNLTCPEPPTNAEFTRALARAVRRPAALPVPAAALRLAAGPMAPELLGSVRARPAALEGAGYSFQDRDVHAVLAAGLG